MLETEQCIQPVGSSMAMYFASHRLYHRHMKHAYLLNLTSSQAIHCSNRAFFETLLSGRMTGWHFYFHHIIRIHLYSHQHNSIFTTHSINGWAVWIFLRILCRASPHSTFIVSNQGMNHFFLNYHLIIFFIDFNHNMAFETLHIY